MSCAAEADRAAGRLEQPHEAADQGRLAAARLADDAERLARVRARTRRRRPRARARPTRSMIRPPRSGSGPAGARPRAAASPLVRPASPGSAPRRVTCATGSGAASPIWSSTTPQRALLARARASSGRDAPGASGQRAAQRRAPRCSVIERMRAARAEVAAGRRVQQRRRQARDRRQPLRAVAVDARDRAEQAPGVGVLRVVEELVERALLDDAARRT